MAAGIALRGGGARVLQRQDGPLAAAAPARQVIKSQSLVHPALPSWPYTCANGPTAYIAFHAPRHRWRPRPAPPRPAARGAGPLTLEKVCSCASLFS